MFSSVFHQENIESKDKQELKEELEDLEFQVCRMQENLKEIAKRWQVIGIDQTKENKWVIVYALDDGNQCKIMLDDCETAYKGKWDFSIHAQYASDHTIHIGDIKGPENKGYGSVCMKYLKGIANQQNVQYITGDIAKRDWNHLDRLVHFYEKHHFRVDVNDYDKTGYIKWNTGA